MLLLSAVVLASCGGSDGTGPSGAELYLKFKANGTLVEYTNAASLFASFSTTSGQSNLVISGFDATSNANLQIFDDHMVTTGTHTGFDAVNSAIVGVIIGYQDSSGVDYVADGTNPSDATIVITDITSTRVSGTFFGVLKASGHADLAITEGQFVVQRIN